MKLLSMVTIVIKIFFSINESDSESFTNLIRNTIIAKITFLSVIGIQLT